LLGLLDAGGQSATSSLFSLPNPFSCVFSHIFTHGLAFSSAKSSPSLVTCVQQTNLWQLPRQLHPDSPMQQIVVVEPGSYLFGPPKGQLLEAHQVPTILFMVKGAIPG
tara:strand:+ start:375 stop:698 length:324 start_codon:yes stop_codon:yes gene_type:complete